ncbi:unnamed protein product [Pleuronectes platessa]|uniref:Uncharacterized protein n=1 Tax=Pleuronectes platessa TaxID=8262 RepID=A0A9N7Z713_PLEPL|nr:unnamed protein product [Pleuronectes platessa]
MSSRRQDDSPPLPSWLHFNGRIRLEILIGDFKLVIHIESKRRKYTTQPANEGEVTCQGVISTPSWLASLPPSLPGLSPALPRPECLSSRVTTAASRSLASLAPG